MRRLHAQQVLAQRLALRPLLDQLPGLVARGWPRAAGYPPAGPNLREDGLRYPWPPVRPRPRTDPRMEKFIIEGGRPLSGTLVPAGNKNAALPALAAIAPDERGGRAAQRAADPRRGGDGRAAARASACQRRVARRQRGRRPRGGRRTTPRSTPSCPSASAPRSCWPARCWPASARADMPPPGGDVIGRRRLDPHLDAFRALGAEVDVGPRWYRAARARRACAPATSSWTSRR